MGDDKDDMFKWLAGGKYKSRSAFGVSQMINDYRYHVKKQFISGFGRELERRVGRDLGEGWSLSVDEDVFEKDQKFRISKAGWKNNYCIALGNELGAFNGIYYGLFARDERGTEKDSLRETISEKFGASRNADDTHDRSIWSRNVDVCYELRENIDNIITLVEKNGEAVIDNWSTQLMELARFVAPHIDRI